MMAVASGSVLRRSGTEFANDFCASLCARASAVATPSSGASPPGLLEASLKLGE
jgi:hypothetical protein